MDKRAKSKPFFDFQQGLSTLVKEDVSQRFREYLDGLDIGKLSKTTAIRLKNMNGSIKEIVITLKNDLRDLDTKADRLFPIIALAIVSILGLQTVELPSRGENTLHVLVGILLVILSTGATMVALWSLMITRADKPFLVERPAFEQANIVSTCSDEEIIIDQFLYLSRLELTLTAIADKKVKYYNQAKASTWVVIAALILFGTEIVLELVM